MKKLIALLLALVMVLGLFAGCGGKTPVTSDDPKPSDDTNPSDSQPAVEDTAGGDPTQDLEPVTLKWYMPFDEMEGSADVEEAFNNRLAELLPNTTVEFVWVGAYDPYFAQWPLLLGGGEEMDIAWVGWGNNLQQDVLDGNIMALSDLVEQYGPNLKAERELWQYDYGCVTLDDELYAIPSIQPNSCKETSQLYIRENIYEYFDVHAILDEAHNNNKCTEKFWDLIENGIQAAVDAGAITVGDNSWNITAFSLIQIATRGYVVLDGSGFGGPLGRWFLDPDAEEITVYNQYEIPEVQAVIARMAEWREKGWITESQVAGQFQDGCLEILGGSGTQQGTWSDLVDEKGVKVAATDSATGLKHYSLLLDKPGQAYVGPSSFGYATTLVIPYTSQNPERAVMLLNLLRDEVGTAGNDLLNMLCYGFESTSEEATTYGWANYTAVEKDGQMEVDVSIRNGADSKHLVDNWVIGNTFKTMHDGGALTTKATKDYALNYWNDVYPKMPTCIVSGEALDNTVVSTDLEALNLVYTEYSWPIRTGGMEVCNEMMNKLASAGLETVRAELVAQIEAIG